MKMKGITRGLLSAVVVGSIAIGYAAETAKKTKREFPLKLDIDVSTKRVKKTIGEGNEGDAKVNWITCKVKIHKVGGQPYTDKLTAELYIIGRQIQTDYYGIIGVVKKEFTLEKAQNYRYEFSSRSYPVGRTSGNINVGGVYETYLVVVVDKDGKIIETRSGRVIKEQGIDFIRKLGPNTLFDRNGNVIGKGQPNSAFKKAIPAAVSGDD